MAGVNRVLTCLEMAMVDDFFAPDFGTDVMLGKQTVFAYVSLLVERDLNIDFQSLGLKVTEDEFVRCNRIYYCCLTGDYVLDEGLDEMTS